MVTRLPTHLDAVIPPPPPPSLQTQEVHVSTLLKPWRGIFLVSGTRASDISSNVEIRVTGVETDGDIKSHIWPPRIVFSITVPHALPILSQLRDYMKNRFPPIPLTTFLPERLRDPDRNVVNQTHFHSLSRLLWDSQSVAVVPISPSDFTTSVTFSQGTARQGMLIYPAANSTSLLIGAIFLTPEDTFPDFVLSARAMPFNNTFSEIPPQDLASRYNAFTGEDTSSVPISPTVIHSQSRQDSQRRASPRSYSSLRVPSVRISSSYRHNPVPFDTLQGHQLPFPETRLSFIAPITNIGSGGAAASLHYGADNSDDNDPALTHPRNVPSYSAQSHSSLERQPVLHSRNTSGESSRSRYNEHGSPEDNPPSDSPQLSESDQQEKELIAASIFNPFDLTTRTRSH
ncbi:uncharacterized protein C8R40DRAFT_1168891 [Lentinula edodes]|uniref:uncharacterized protein n=1 Tax=Lentinula edodes TaxID=5353 RepID=UPI001E8D6C3C|nr:uncharacterized protein C8R40DRAFT_1168891 [Lentinula edodes]KAH7876967.1 hypothetical protein C8R40DRAFT_1168891 [Lentinula edodes]